MIGLNIHLFLSVFYEIYYPFLYPHFCKRRFCPRYLFPSFGRVCRMSCRDADYLSVRRPNICRYTAAVNTDVLSASGDYFYVLYTINQSMNYDAWRNRWATGADYPYTFPMYNFSRFYVASERIPVILVPGIGGSWNFDVLLRDTQSDNWSFMGGEGPYGGLINALESLGD